ncbi:MAG: hypothetical protein EOO23_04325 [Comamonadaceae bacterium]|nr:MAG: hypothetical protein EOO23_04325 [Comamonadaceae bacterium]
MDGSGSQGKECARQQKKVHRPLPVDLEPAGLLDQCLAGFTPEKPEANLLEIWFSASPVVGRLDDQEAL